MPALVFAVFALVVLLAIKGRPSRHPQSIRRIKKYQDQ